MWQSVRCSLLGKFGGGVDLDGYDDHRAMDDNIVVFDVVACLMATAIDD